ncbi:hypothetical protein MRS44_005236 [Fusarium solani]|uniref:uncharacterized protein n=1 Tax=Fusarium solani TaxID=169388 RepID=UPI0032C4386E|nr:hypothetical protein MRS44_005236 [Fusarium solani]
MATRDTLSPVMAAFIGIDVFVVLARLGVRIKLTTLGYDDYVIAVALVGFILMCSFCFMSLSYGFGETDPLAIAKLENYNVMEASRYFTIAQITYVAGFPIVRISVALVLHRIVQGWPRTSVYSWYPWSSSVSTLWAAFWSMCCTGLGFAVSALDIASALFYAVLPVFLLKGLQMGTRTKVAIIILLGLGAGTVIVSIVRLKSLIQIVGSKDIAAALDLQLESFIYSVLEFGLSILTASLVAFRPLIKYLPFGSHGRSSGFRGPSAGTGPSGTGGTNNFEMGRRNYVNVPDPARMDSDDGDSQRNILREETNSARDWKHSETNVTITTKIHKS